MNNIFKECRILKEELDSLRPLKKEDEMRIMQKFRLDWNYHSNHLEGNSLTYGETKALILFGITAQGKPLKDHFEVTGHDDALNWVFNLVKKERELTENFIRELHTLILKESYEVDAITPEGKPTKKTINVGQYKKTSNHVKTKTGEIFRFATPEDTPILMNELVLWYNKKSKSSSVNPILLASEFHYKYIRIHPFDDGNGRTARILMNFILLSFGYPPVIVKTEDRNDYFSSLQQADAGIIESFMEFIASNLKNSLQIMIKGAKGESIEEKDDLAKEIALLEQSVKAVSRPIKIPKSRESILALFNSTICEVAKIFISRSNLMDRFYFKSHFNIAINNLHVGGGKENALTRTRNQIKGTNNPSKLTLMYNYNTFNQAGIGQFNFSSKITFNFKETEYIVSNDNFIFLHKLYGEDLSKDEILKLVDGTIKKHRDLIKNKLKTFKDKKIS